MSEKTNSVEFTPAVIDAIESLQNENNLILTELENALQDYTRLLLSNTLEYSDKSADTLHQSMIKMDGIYALSDIIKKLRK